MSTITPLQLKFHILPMLVHVMSSVKSQMFIYIPMGICLFRITIYTFTHIITCQAIPENTTYLLIVTNKLNKQTKKMKFKEKNQNAKMKKGE